MDEFDRHLITFVITWAPFGGPMDEDTFPRFGLRAEKVLRRFNRIVANAELRLGSFANDDADLIRRARMYVAEDSPRPCNSDLLNRPHRIV